MLGPHEEVAKLYLMDAHTTDEISCDVAQFLNLSSVECTAILARYYAEEKREIAKIEAKYVHKDIYDIFSSTSLLNLIPTEEDLAFLPNPPCVMTFIFLSIMEACLSRR